MWTSFHTGKLKQQHSVSNSKKQYLDSLRQLAIRFNVRLEVSQNIGKYIDELKNSHFILSSIIFIFHRVLEYLFPIVRKSRPPVPTITPEPIAKVPKTTPKNVA